MKAPAPILLSLSIAMSPSLTGAAPKTDKVVLRNGDHFTCEVKDLEDARLRIKTDDAGTILRIPRISGPFAFAYE